MYFGGATPTQMQQPKASALVKPLSERVCNSPLEPICIQTHTCTHKQISSFVSVQTYSISYFTQNKNSYRHKGTNSLFPSTSFVCAHVWTSGCSQVCAVGEWQRAVTLCSGFSLGCGSKSLGCHFFSDLPPPLSSQTTQRTRQRETERFKGWQQHRSLEVLSLPLTVLQRGFKGCRERERGGGGGREGYHTAYLSFFFLLCVEQDG